jgi:hypothetical protein
MGKHKPLLGLELPVWRFAACSFCSVQQNVQHWRVSMVDFLTRRHGTWHFVRRVPTEFAAFDRRRIIKHSTKIRIADDRNGRRASSVADKLNRELETFWRAKPGNSFGDEISRYELARRQVRSLGFDLLDMARL